MTDLADWQGCAAPAPIVHQGQYARLEPLDWNAHLAGLSAALIGKGREELWTYLPSGPFSEPQDFQNWLESARTTLEDPWLTFVVRSESGAADGILSFMRQRPAHGSVEVGCVIYGSALARSRAATEAVFLLARHLFDDLGYRRFEWKCNARNAASRRAAERLGFVYEGTFRHDLVVKGANRDTSWYAMTDDDWPAIKHRFEQWLSPENFDDTGQQRCKLR